MTVQERSELVLSAAQVLFVNGQSTDRTIAAVGSFARALGLQAQIIPRWGELYLHAQDGHATRNFTLSAAPTGVNMTRVTSAMRLIEDPRTARLHPAAAKDAINAIAQLPPAPAWLFTLAAAAGATALAVIFGVQHLPAVALIFASAAAGAILRRGLARYSANIFIQPFCAALLAGIIGGLAVRYQWSSALRLVAVCPCMVLVPGPHMLNGALDLFKGRIHLGSARLIYAGLVIVSICVGLLLGLALLGTSLPVGQAGRIVPLWLDTLAAGVAVAAFSVFFSMPLNMLPWPTAIGMLAHALRWWIVTEIGGSAALGAFLACLLVGLILTPVALRAHMPFAAIGFASVVSMIPGVFLFRTASGLSELADGSRTTLPILSATISDGMTAITVILAMSFGLLVPKMVIDRLHEERMRRRR
jgi:uncharacterized membrane protein YjjP (DUF1212 family)